MESAIEAYESVNKQGAPMIPNPVQRAAEREAISVRKASAAPSESVWLWTDFISSVLLVTLIAALCIGLVGCGTTGSSIQTPPSRVTCTKASDEAYVISFFKVWSWVLKVAQVVDSRDGAALCSPASVPVKPASAS